MQLVYYIYVRLINKKGEKMKNLKPKIEKVLVKTINDHFKGYYKANAYEGKIAVRNIADPEWAKKYGNEEWFFVPEYDHEEAYCFMCDGGTGWDLVNPDESGHGYKFEEALDANFKAAGLFCEPYASWKHIVTEV